MADQRKGKGTSIGGNAGYMRRCQGEVEGRVGQRFEERIESRAS
jgi:hypothetical protein